MERRSPATARRWAAWLAQWAALAALYYVAIRLALSGRAGPPVAWLAAGNRIVGFAALLGAASLRLAAGALGAASQAAEDRRALARSLAGAPPQDGKRYAAAGRIAPLGPPLAAPLSGAACVAYRYSIGSGEAKAGQPVDPAKPAMVGAELASARLAFAGLGLAPAAISTAGPAGEVRLLGFPRLEGFPEAALDGDAPRARAAAYVGATPCEEIGAGDLARVSSEILAIAADAEAPLRRDWRVAGRRAIEPGDRLIETLVAAGAEVCALGLFHAAEGGVAPDPSPEGRPLRLIRGDAGAVAAVLAREGRGPFLLGLALLVVPHAVLAALLLAR